MAVRRLAERPPMQAVGLDEDVSEYAEPVRSAPERLHEAYVVAARTPTRAIVVAAVAVAVILVGSVAGPRWLTQRERDSVLGAAAFDGAVRSLAHEPAVRWSADIDGAVAPLLVGDVVVAARGSIDEGRRLEGLDAVSGATRWSIPLGADPVPDTVLCRPVGGLLTCVVGPVPPPDLHDLVPNATDEDTGTATLWAIDPHDGTVLAQHPIGGWVMSTAAVEDDLVVSTYAFGLLTVRRVDPRTADQVWQTQRFATTRSTTNGRIKLVAAGGLVMAQGNDVTLLLDAATGRRLPRDSEALGVDETRLATDGSLVHAQYRLLDSAIVSRSTISTGTGDPWLTAEGSVLTPEVSDHRSDLVFTVDGLGNDGVRAYRPGTDDQAWLSTATATRVSVDAGKHVVLRDGGVLTGLDPGSGHIVWTRDLGTISGGALSDGQRVAVQSGGPADTDVVIGIDLSDGDVLWQVELPAGTSRVVQLGTQLYAVGDDTLVALR